ncbi:MAG: type II toxin-antitoxin system HicA family toxin [Spirochaetales bacterium]|nr:type II toxin-antitoxin system HicA family toxin [Spirochaetales bacterium]
MSSWDKLLEKIKSLNKDMRFAELQKVLQNYGYVMTAPRSGSSHYIFRKKGCNPITIPKHEPIKTVYVKMVREIIETEQTSGNAEE